jgi:hypothetical protein
MSDDATDSVTPAPIEDRPMVGRANRAPAPTSSPQELAVRGGEGDASQAFVAPPSPTEAQPSPTEAVEQPGKVMRIGSMIKQLLEEVRREPLDEPSRTRLREIYEISVRELAAGLSPDLVAELDRLALPFDSSTPSEAELRVAQAQLVGWLEGLFHGIQATLFAQQMAAQSQLEEIRRRGLPAGEAGQSQGVRPGNYL